MASRDLSPSGGVKSSGEGSGFTLDTSGSVTLPRIMVGFPTTPEPRSIAWSDLTPFAQGYVEALISGPVRGRNLATLGFSDLSPEALAKVIADCEDNTREFIQPRGFSEVSRNNGRHFWALRNAGFWPDRWPRLTPHLSDDGRVYLREEA